MGSTGKENLIAGAPEEGGITAVMVPGEKEAQRASEGTPMEAAVAPKVHGVQRERKPLHR